MCQYGFIIGIDPSRDLKDTIDRTNSYLKLIKKFSDNFALKSNNPACSSQGNWSGNFGFPVIIAALSTAHGDLSAEAMKSYRESQGFLRKCCLCIGGSLVDVTTDNKESCDRLRRFVADCLSADPDPDPAAHLSLQIEVSFFLFDDDISTLSCFRKHLDLLFCSDETRCMFHSRWFRFAGINLCVLWQQPRFRCKRSDRTIAATNRAFNRNT